VDPASSGEVKSSVPLKPKYVVGKPNILDRALFLERVEQILDTAIHTNDGPFARRLEDLVKEELDVQHCIALANATLALELLLQSLNKVGEVIVPSFTFVATAHSIVRSGLTPIFCDVDERGLIDCDHVERLINKSTACILPVNVYGNVCNVARLKTISQKCDIPVIYDSAHALGVKENGIRLGGFGAAEVFSLHATKFISGFEGGLITTNSAELADKLRSARNFGFAGYDAVESIGTNAKLSEIHAAMALTNLEKLEQIIAHNRDLFDIYSSRLKPPLQLICPADSEQSNYQYVPVLCPPELRNHILSELFNKSIFARRYFYPGVHRMGAYQHLNLHLPRTESLSESVICLPTGSAISQADAALIAETINQAAG
jgi:dTDP-4-amino-4,6-dideoxygalactose transaminase